MSVFGGDSWAREAKYRKRRVDDLVVESLEVASFKKLSNGKFACLLCPHRPILDSPLMFSTHSKGSRHRAAEAKLKERELAKRDEVNKRIALEEYPSDGTPNLGTYNHKLKSIPSKPARNLATSEMLGVKTSIQAESNKNQRDPTLSSSGSQGIAGTSVSSRLNIANCSSFPAVVEVSEVVGEQHLDYRKRRERESSSLLLQGGSEIVMGNGTKMRMLSLTLMKRIQMSALAKPSCQEPLGVEFCLLRL